MRGLISLEKYSEVVKEVEVTRCTGQVVQVIGLTVEAEAPSGEVGEICYIHNIKDTAYIQAEIVGFHKDRVLLMPYGELNGIGAGSKVLLTNKPFMLPVGSELVGRILDGLGNPIDDKGPVGAQNWVSSRILPLFNLIQYIEFFN